MLLATLPHITEEGLMEEIISHPLVAEVRYNTGYDAIEDPPYSAEETLERILRITERYGKKLWIDLEGRQLRIARWAYPRDGGKVLLNSEVLAEEPQAIYFRHDGWYGVKFIRGNRVYLETFPRRTIGEGQSVNIKAKSVIVLPGYLREIDKNFLAAGAKLGCLNFMLSFVEAETDQQEAEAHLRDLAGHDPQKNPAEFIWKIESRPGLELVGSLASGLPANCGLMAARDDLLTNIGESAETFAALAAIVKADPGAICASRIFSGIEEWKKPIWQDYADLILMRRLGYRRFMLSDGICHDYFQEAMEAWSDFISHYPLKQRKRR